MQQRAQNIAMQLQATHPFRSARRWGDKADLFGLFHPDQDNFVLNQLRHDLPGQNLISVYVGNTVRTADKFDSKLFLWQRGVRRQEVSDNDVFK